MVHGEAIIELLTETLNNMSIDNYYTLGYKDGIKEAIGLIQIAESIKPFKEMEVSNA